jgi:beta-N-acetylhexosaminidase
MTAHVFAPALDEKRPATLSRHVVTDLLRNELGFEGVILSDDLEMKAIANNYAVPEAAVLAIEAGCDGVLICSADYDTQAHTLEALIYAVESERLPYARVEDALKRQQRAKERFLGAAMVSRPADAKTLRQIIGREQHRAIADEMARFL